MRVLHAVTVVDDEGSFGGALTVAVQHCIELRRRGHDARVAGGWGGRGPAPTQLEGVPVHLFRVHRVAPRHGTPGLLSPGLTRWARRQAPTFDVAHLHLSRDLLPLAVARLLRRAGVGYVVQTHGMLGPRTGPLARFLDRRMIRPALLSARHVFAATIEERDAIARVSGTSEGISLLPGGVVLPDRVPATGAGGPADVLFLGRLLPNRRVMAFAAAADRLVADGVDATFTVVGPDGGDLRTLRRFLAARPQLAGRLIYQGTMRHDRAVERLRRADLYVLPSVDGQAYPITLLEAMAAGVPSIVTTECSLAGTLAREHAAIVANPTDDALYGAMRRMLTDRTARARLSAAAAATAASVFSMAPVAEVLEQEYGAAARRVPPPGIEIDLRATPAPRPGPVS
ncbi:MAG TPA: glycosyltransferase [Kineosporiaceae bacterium]